MINAPQFQQALHSCLARAQPYAMVKATLGGNKAKAESKQKKRAPASTETNARRLQLELALIDDVRTRSTSRPNQSETNARRLRLVLMD